MGVERRLMVLEQVFAPARPPGCGGGGDLCRRFEVVRQAADDLSEPIPPPAVCPRCERPTFTRTIVLVRDDGEPLPPLPDVVGVDPGRV